MEDRGDRERAGDSALRWAWEWVKVLATAFLIFLFVRAFVVEAFQIPTSSMEDTLQVGDFLLVNKAVYGAEVPGIEVRLPAFSEPGLGDVVVFAPPPDAGQPPEARYVKRIVGMPGDTLSMEDGRLYRNGHSLEEPYVKEARGPRASSFSQRFLWQRPHRVREGRAAVPYRPTRDDWGPVEIPRDHYFVLGDHRDNSEDSRYWGFVPRDRIIGKPLVVYFSYDRASSSPLPWITDVRWERILSPVR